jgi:hypothetical protein
MANEIDGEIYPRNNAHTTCRPSRWQLNPTTGVEEEVPISGLTDLRAYLSASADATSHTTGALHPSLAYSMIEVLATAAYQATILGSDTAANVTSADGTTLYVHWQAPSAGYHEFTPVIWRTKRPAAT